MAGRPKTRAKKAAEAKTAPSRKAAKGKTSSAIPTFVTSYIELGRILGVTRQTLSKWAKIAGAPTSRSDGRHSVAQWRNFMTSNDLSGKSHDLDSLKARDLLVKCEEREFNLAKKRGEFVSLEEVRLAWSSYTAKAMQHLEKALLDELPPILAGKEPIEIRTDIDRQLMEVRRILHKGEGLTP